MMLSSLLMWRLTLGAHCVVFCDLHALFQNFICKSCLFCWRNITSVFSFTKKWLWGLVSRKFQKWVTLDRHHRRICTDLWGNECLTFAFLVQVSLIATARLHRHQCVITGVLARLGPLLLHKCGLIGCQLQTFILNYCLRIMPRTNHRGSYVLNRTRFCECVHFEDSCVVHRSAFDLLIESRFIFRAICLPFTLSYPIKSPDGLVVKNSADHAFLRKTRPISFLQFMLLNNRDIWGLWGPSGWLVSLLRDNRRHFYDTIFKTRYIWSVLWNLHNRVFSWFTWKFFVYQGIWLVGT